MKPFTEKEILDELDHVFENDIEHHYNDTYRRFFLDLEPTNLYVAGNKIHLYANDEYWAVVFEKDGYSFSAGFPRIELDYVGNCVSLRKTIKKDFTEYSNSFTEILIEDDEVDNIRTKEDDWADNLIRKDVEFINVNGHKVRFEQDPKEYEKHGIELVFDEEFDKEHNPEGLIPFECFIRYLNETEPEFSYADESLVKSHLSVDIPKLMTIDKYHYISFFDNVIPSEQELFQLIAKILVTKDTLLWKPTLPANNHWSNWESGMFN